MPDVFDMLDTQDGDVFDRATPETVSTARGLVASLQRGFQTAAAIPEVLQATAFADLHKPSILQERAAFERALSDPRFSQALTEAGDDTVLAGRAAQLFGPAAQLDQIMTRPRAMQEATMQNVAQAQEEIRALPQSAAQQRMGSATTSGDKWKAWLQDPIELTASIALESLPPAIAGSVLGAPAGPTGVAAGAGAASGLATFSSELLGSAGNRGVDIRNGESLTSWLRSPEFDQDVDTALTKATVVGGVDAATAGMAGQFVKPALREGLRRVLGASGKEFAVQALGGSVGEAAGQLASGQPLDLFDVAMEGIAEVASTPGEVLSNLRGTRNEGTSGSPLATPLEYEMPSTSQPSRLAPDKTRVAPETVTPTGEATPGEVRTEVATTVPQPEIVGMGGALAGEVAPQGTGLKNAIGELERIGHGLEEAAPTEKRSMGAAWERSAQQLGENPRAGEELAASLKENPERGITDNDSALLLRHKIDLLNAKNSAAERTFTAETPEAKAEAEAAFNNYSKQLEDLLDAVKSRGSQWGREGRWRQALAFEDYSFESMRRERSQASGREITPESPEYAEIKTLHDRIAELERKIAEGERAGVEAESTTAATDALERTVKQGRATPTAADRGAVLEGLQEAVQDSGAIPDDLARYVKELFKYHVERGANTLATATKAVKSDLEPIIGPVTDRQIADWFSDYGKSTPATKDAVKITLSQLRGEAQKTSALQDVVEKNQAPLATGPRRVPQSDATRRITKKIHEEMKKRGIQVTDPARQLATSIQTIKTRLDNAIADIRFELSTRSKIVKQKGVTPSDAEVVAKRAELAELRRQRDEIFGPREMTDAQRLALAERAAERNEIYWNDRLERAKHNDFGTGKPVKPELRSAAIDAIKARIKAARAEFDQLRALANPKLTPEEMALKAAHSRTLHSIADLQDRVARGDFLTPLKKPSRLVPDDKLNQLRAENEKWKQQYREGNYKARMAQRTAWEKTKAGIRQAWRLPKNLVASFDLSAPRQALGALLAAVPSPSRWGQTTAAFRDMIQSVYKSEDFTNGLIQERLNRTNATNGIDKQSKVEYTKLDETSFTAAEENARSILDDWAKLNFRTGNLAKTVATAPVKFVSKGVHISNRAFSVFLNKIRADLLDTLVANEFADQAPTKAQLEKVGNLVNVMTGRGALNPKTQSVAGVVLWSPKLLASRIQTLLGQPFFKAGLDAKMQKMVAKEYLRMLIGGAVLWNVSQLFGEVEDDPRSSDYRKTRIGNTRVDPWGGFQQVTVAVYRLASGETKTLDGQVSPIRGEGVEFGRTKSKNVAWNFFRSKLNPEAGLVYDVVLGDMKNPVGEPITPGSTVAAMTIPLSFKDLFSIAEEHGIPTTVVLTALNIFGFGVSQYEKEKQK